MSSLRGRIHFQREINDPAIRSACPVSRLPPLHYMALKLTLRACNPMLWTFKVYLKTSILGESSFWGNSRKHSGRSLDFIGNWAVLLAFAYGLIWFFHQIRKSRSGDTSWNGDIMVFCCFSYCFSRFIVYCCLLAFTLLFSLRLDGIISWNYWVVFLPLWIWKLMVINGAVVGSYVWWTHPQYRYLLSPFIFTGRASVTLCW